MQSPVAAYLDGGKRLHLQHGPIDLIIGVDAPDDHQRQEAFRAAAMRFDGLLEGLVGELGYLRAQLLPDTPNPADPVARRMAMAARPFCGRHFLTSMIAVAGAVADEILHAMRAATPLTRAYVNNGGDIALHLAAGSHYTAAIASHDGLDLGRARLSAGDGIGGIATSGVYGRSHSLGIADSVTVLATDAAAADVAATLIANQVDLPDHPAIARARASELSPDSDLGDRLVVTCVNPLDPDDRARALHAGAEAARKMLDAGQIAGAAMFLQGRYEVVGTLSKSIDPMRKEVLHA
ncbi:MAG: UPF0280 family protein [Nitratireductor sp.]|nr:UPF0280 family protein [Nitratireductor sp.]